MAGQNKAESKKKFAVATCLHAVFFRALANPYNYVDTGWYYRGFYEMSAMKIDTLFSTYNPYIDWGVGFDFLIWCIGHFSHNPVSLYIIVALLTLVPLYNFFYKTSDNLFLTIIIFVLYPMLYLHGFGVIRQHLAVTFVLLALYYIDIRKISIPLAMLAISIHTSAIVFIPYYIWRILPFKKMAMKKALFYICCSVIVGRMMLSSILSSLSRYSELLTSGEVANNIVPVLLIGGAVFVGFLGKMNKKLDGIRNELFNFSCYGLAIALFGIGIPGMGRLTLYFIYVIPVLVTFFPFALQKYKNIGVSYVILLFILIVILRAIDLNGKNSFNYNYSFFWEKSTTFENYL